MPRRHGEEAVLGPELDPAEAAKATDSSAAEGARSGGITFGMWSTSTAWPSALPEIMGHMRHEAPESGHSIRPLGATGKLVQGARELPPLPGYHTRQRQGL